MWVAGPAGMEAARVAALKGHDVTLYERRQLGGTLVEAAIPDFKQDLRPLIKYFTTQLAKTGVKVVPEEATAAGLAAAGYDAIVIATGSAPHLPTDIPGMTMPHVIGALDVLRGARTGDNAILALILASLSPFKPADGCGGGKGRKGVAPGGPAMKGYTQCTLQSRCPGWARWGRRWFGRGSWR